MIILIHFTWVWIDGMVILGLLSAPSLPKKRRKKNGTKQEKKNGKSKEKKKEKKKGKKKEKKKGKMKEKKKGKKKEKKKGKKKEKKSTGSLSPTVNLEFGLDNPSPQKIMYCHLFRRKLRDAPRRELRRVSRKRWRGEQLQWSM